MCFEEAFNKHRPVFITPTYEEEPDDIQTVVSDLQEWFKRIRQRGDSCRYFVSVERGTKKGRLHAHAVLWSNINAEKSGIKLRMYYESAWNKGFCFVRSMYGGRSGFNYVSKYILKNPLWYSYSRRPGLGNVGKHAYIERCVDRFIRSGRFIDRMHIPVIGKMMITTVHSGWQREARDILGLTKCHKTKRIHLKLSRDTYGEKIKKIMGKPE
jgi:hypothetical protein